MAGSGKSSSSGTQISQPWRGQQPYLSTLYSQARGSVAQQPLEYYPGSTVAPRDPSTQAYLSALGARGAAGSDLTGGAQNLAQRTMAGDYLQGNPYLDEMYGRAARGMTTEFNRAIMPNLEARFARAGRTGSPSYGGALGAAGERLSTGLGDLAAKMYGGAYETERGRQMQAMGQAPGLAAEDYRDIGALGQVSAAEEQYNQRLLNDLINRFNFGQDEPYERLVRYANLIGSPVMETMGRQKSDAAQGFMSIF